MVLIQLKVQGVVVEHCQLLAIHLAANRQLVRLQLPLPAMDSLAVLQAIPAGMMVAQVGGVVHQVLDLHLQ